MWFFLYSFYFSKTMNIGAVATMPNIKNAIGVARRVLENTQHTLLAGEGATEFAIQMGFKNESLSTESSNYLWKDWKTNRCQPNFWMVIKFCCPNNCVFLNFNIDLNL